jgi:ABC-type nitrate/sulfonate/bicarbonate transport system permease component
MRNRRLRTAAIAGITVGVLIAVSSLVSGTLGPPLAVVGAIPPAVIVGVLVYVTLPVLGSRR